MTVNNGTDNQVWRTAENVVIRKIADETLLVPISGNLANMQHIFTVNEVGAAFLARLNGRKSVAEILRELLDEFDVDENRLKNDLFDFIDQLKASNLIMERSA